jgi:hypothetical protein
MYWAAQIEGLSFCAVVFAFSPNALRLTPNLRATERGGWGKTCGIDGRGKSERNGQRLPRIEREAIAIAITFVF